MFYEIFLKLCNAKNISPNGVAKELGFSTGTVTWWKKGREPRDSALQKIADYFDVSVDYLLGKQEAPSVDEDAVLDARIAELWAQLDDDARADALKYIEYLKARG